MKTKMIVIGLVGLMIGTIPPACKKSSDTVTGCTDVNADNFDDKANKNDGCTYRHASNIDLDDIPVKKPDGTDWDDGDGPDLRINFGKSSNSGYTYSTSISSNYTTGVATVTPSSDVTFTNEMWKFELVDNDLLTNEVIATGTFNPLKLAVNNTIKADASNGVSVKFKYTVK